MVEWVSVFQTLGVPVGVMLVMFWGLWRCARWAAPRADDVINTHKNFVNELSVTVGKIHGRIDDVHADVRDIKEAIRK